MVGKIKTYEKCPVCKGPFESFDRGMICLQCKTKPNGFYIDLNWKGSRHKLYRNRDGILLSSFSLAEGLWKQINEDILKGRFVIDNYLQKEIDQFRGKVLIEKWYKLKESQLAPSTIKHLRGSLDLYIIPFFEKIDMKELATYHIEDFQAQLPSRLHQKTVKIIMGNLKTFCFWLMNREIIAKMPVFPTISPPKPQIHWIPREVQLKILDSIPLDHKPIFAFMIDHPVRPGEARCLKVKDFHISEGFLSVERAFSENEERSRKSKEPYNLAISSGFDVNILKDKLPEAYVFVNRAGRPYSHGSIRKIWTKACKRAGITHITLYNGTRHSIATQSVQDGIDLAVISKALGHSNMQMTTRYAKMDFKASRLVVDRAVVSAFNEKKVNSERQ